MPTPTGLVKSPFYRRLTPLLGAFLLALLALACANEETDDTGQGKPGVEASPATRPVVPVPEIADSPLEDPTPLEPSGRSPGLVVTAAPITPTPYETQVEPKANRANRSVETTFLLEASMHWPNESKAPQLPGLSREAQGRASVAFSRQMTIELEASGKLRLTVDGGALPLPRGSVLLGDAQHFGHLLVWPNGEQYRVLPPGSLLAVMREYRPDVAPLVKAKVSLEKASKERRFGFPLSTLRLETERGSVAMQTVELAEIGPAAPLLCRLLLDVLAVVPSVEACRATQVPVRADFDTPQGTIEFVVTSLKPAGEATISPLVRPRTARFVKHGLPELPETFLESKALQAFIGGDEETARLEVVNGSDLGAYLLWSGTPISYLAPKSRRTFNRVRTGPHELELRGVFGDVILERRNVEVGKEERFEIPVSVPDAGAAR